jgi:hypothetical protein
MLEAVTELKRAAPNAPNYEPPDLDSETMEDVLQRDPIAIVRTVVRVVRMIHCLSTFVYLILLILSPDPCVLASSTRVQQSCSGGWPPTIGTVTRCGNTLVINILYVGSGTHPSIGLFFVTLCVKSLRLTFVLSVGY